MRSILLALGLSLLVGCATHKPTKTDNSAASGFTQIDDGAKQIEDGIFKVKNGGQLTPEQSTGVTLIENGRKTIGGGAVVARKAYDAASAQASKDRAWVFRIYDLCVIGGGLVIVLGLYITFTAVMRASSVIPGIGFVVTGAGAIVVFASIQIIEAWIYWLAAGLAIITVCGIAYVVFDRLRVHRKLKVEQKATKEIAAVVPQSQIDAMPISSTTADLLAKAKADCAPAADASVT